MDNFTVRTQQICTSEDRAVRAAQILKTCAASQGLRVEIVVKPIQGFWHVRFIPSLV